MQLFRFQKAYSPLLVSNARSGTLLLPEIAARMTEAGRAIPDTDWHLSRVLDLPVLESAAVISANLSRYIVDLNLPADALMVPGSQRTAHPPVVPVTTLAGDPIYRPGEEPDAAEIQRRMEHYYHPFYRQIAEELTRMTSRFGRVLLVDVRFGDDRGQSGIAFPAIRLNLSPLQEGDPDLGRFLEDLAETLPPETIRFERQNPAAIVQRFDHLPAVDTVEICLNPSSFLEPDGLEFDFVMAAELNESLEPLLVALLKWAERLA